MSRPGSAQRGAQKSVPMMYIAATTIAIIAAAPPAMMSACVLVGRPPARCDQASPARRVRRRGIGCRTFGQTSSSNDTIASQPVQGQPFGATEGSASVPGAACRTSACAAASRAVSESVCGAGGRASSATLALPALTATGSGSGLAEGRRSTRCTTALPSAGARCSAGSGNRPDRSRRCRRQSGQAP